MRVFTRVDFTELRRTHALTQRATGPAAREALRDLAAPRIRIASEEAKVRAYDTGRIVQALQRAHNKLGRGLLALTAIRPSRYARLYLKKFQQDYDRLSIIEKRLEAKRTGLLRRPDRIGYSRKWVREELRITEKHLRNIGRVLDRLADNIRRADAQPDAVVIGGFGGANGRRRAKGPFALSNVAQVVTKLYGADVTISERGGSAVLELRVKEPHAVPVDRRTRIISRSMIGAVPAGKQEALRRFVKEIRDKGNWKPALGAAA